ncbi:MAG: His-Xaa-Ser system radical SAM maturase HxsC [Lachnospiraceae bacterium]|jgi:His-Xaa-Ser system radical SAM maturase HxsC|nr:His-Xaa-Ser system radical SAM maturase HxsC [Lachnospiraceae bacterium]MCH4063277.1 His-Xaa-Ser system radical SAM maturase HxsC [Lachnospiraceae bacterium]MCH4105100.1 His-Xaa-Ser system radical SAM maturase HxsC [Lachnospiraceae bacterium]
MIGKLRDYNLGDRIYSFSNTEKSKEYLVDNDLEFLNAVNGKVHLSTGEQFEAVRVGGADIENCHDCDVLYLDRRGGIHLLYSESSRDNAIVLTSACNSNCVMCPVPEQIRRNNEQMDIALLREEVRHIPKTAEHITITGGEPFLYGPDIFSLFQCLKENLNCTQYLLLTNGRVFAYETVLQKYLEAAPAYTLIGIPLHGNDAETHDAVTQAKGSFEETCVGIRNLLSAHQSVEIRIVVSRLNADFISRIAELIANEFPTVEVVRIMGLEMTGNAFIRRDRVWLSYPEAFRASEEAIKTLIRAGIDVKLYNFPLCAVPAQYHFLCARSISSYKIRFSPKCAACRLKDACGGIFASALKLAEPDIKPWS